jgi:hypothetical protein
MTAEYDEILDGIFHGCALHAFLDQAEEERGWPSCDATGRRAFAYFEEALAKKNAAEPAGEERRTTASRPRDARTSHPDSHYSQCPYEKS